MRLSVEETTEDFQPRRDARLMYADARSLANNFASVPPSAPLISIVRFILRTPVTTVCFRIYATRSAESNIEHVSCNNQECTKHCCCGFDHLRAEQSSYHDCESDTTVYKNNMPTVYLIPMPESVSTYQSREHNHRLMEPLRTDLNVCEKDYDRQSCAVYQTGTRRNNSQVIKYFVHSSILHI